jgi:tetratricopeptide (TPR) repeat protein
LLCDVNFSGADLQRASFWGTTLDDRSYRRLQNTAWWAAMGWNSGHLEKLLSFPPVNKAEAQAIRQILTNSDRFRQDFQKPILEAKPATLERAFALNDMAWALATWGIDGDNLQTTPAPCNTNAYPRDELDAAKDAVCTLEDLTAKASKKEAKDQDYDYWLATFRDTEAYILMQANRMAEARVLYEKDIERTEQDGAALFRYAVVVSALGNEQEARNKFETVLGMNYLPRDELHNLKPYIPPGVSQMFYEVIDRAFPAPQPAKSCGPEPKSR